MIQIASEFSAGNGRARLRLLRAAARLGFAGLLLCGAPAVAEDSTRLPKLYTNEQSIDDATNRSSLDIRNVKSVFAYVLAQLPARVRVFPTENYYYFYFFHDGVRYSGNFRFDVDERDKGLVEFIYFKDTTDWSEDEEDHHATFGKDDGVSLTKVEDLVYRLSFENKSVTFALNDLSEVRPPAGALGEDEQFLGPVADESGIRFFLVFDRSMKAFRYVLDETVPLADELINPPGYSHITIGRRTGFAFLRNDVGPKRTLLVGVYAPNIDVNNYLDGPFDQLPDNFLKGDELRQAILAANPAAENESLDRLGISPGGESRAMIAPYMEYGAVEDLGRAEKCAAAENQSAANRCLDRLFSD